MFVWSKGDVGYDSRRFCMTAVACGWEGTMPMAPETRARQVTAAVNFILKKGRIGEVS